MLSVPYHQHTAVHAKRTYLVLFLISHLLPLPNPLPQGKQAVLQTEISNISVLPFKSDSHTHSLASPGILQCTVALPRTTSSSEALSVSIAHKLMLNRCSALNYSQFTGHISQHSTQAYATTAVRTQDIGGMPEVTPLCFSWPKLITIAPVCSSCRPKSKFLKHSARSKGSGQLVHQLFTPARALPPIGQVIAVTFQPYLQHSMNMFGRRLGIGLCNPYLRPINQRKHSSVSSGVV